MRKKTHDEYVLEVAKINPDIEVIDQYINVNTKIMHRCKLDGYEWMAFPSNIIKGHGCPHCANRKKSIRMSLTEDEYKQKLFDINPSIQFIGKYQNANTKAMHRCKICGHQWMAYPSNTLNGKGCKKCADKNNADMLRRSHDTYVSQVQNINNSVVVLGKYINARTPIKHKCKICEYEWETSPDSILHGHGCPRCIESNGEKDINEYLSMHSIKFIRQYTFVDCKNIKVLPFDFYLPEYDMCIEYDGTQHFEPVEFFGGQKSFEATVKRDAIKTNYCISNDIMLIRIKYDEDVTEILDKYFNNLKKLEEAVECHNLRKIS